MNTNRAQILSRRAILVYTATASVSAILAACGGNSTATDTPKPAARRGGATNAPAPTAAAPANAAASPRAAGSSKGELKLALGFDFPAKINALKDTHLSPYGMLETLTRATPENKL